MSLNNDERDRLIAELNLAQSWDVDDNNDEEVHFQLGYTAALCFALGIPGAGADIETSELT